MTIKEPVMRGGRIGDLISHDVLFAAYPQLKNLLYEFDDLKAGVRGYMPADGRGVFLDNSLRRDVKELRKTLSHEIQHYIQKIEGFSKGSSPEHFAAKYPVSKLEIENKKKIKSILNGLDNNTANKYYRYKDLGWAIDKMIEADAFPTDGNKLLQLEKSSDEHDDLYTEFYGEEWFSEISKLERQIRNPAEFYRSLYYNTAGEIEARDTAARLDLNAEQRKEKRPDIDRDGVVFADGDNSMEIVTLDNGKQYVRATEQVIQRNDSSKWGNQVTDYINKYLRDYKDFSISTVEGDVLTLTRDTAYKAGKRNVVNGIAQNDDEYRTKLNAEAHINEIAEIARSRSNSKITKDYKYHRFAKNGFVYRTAYFEDFDGSYYRLTISIGLNGNVSTVYNVGKIKEDTFPGGKIVSALSGSKAVDVSSNSIIPDSSKKSNSKSEIEGKSSKDDAFVVTDDGDLFFGEESGALDEVNPDDELGRTYGEIIEDEVNAGNSSRIDVRKLIDEYSPEQAVFMLYEAAMSTNERGVRGYSGIKLEDEDYIRAARRVMKRYGILKKNNQGFDAEFAQRIREFVEDVVNNPKSEFRTHISRLAIDYISKNEKTA